MNVTAVLYQLFDVDFGFSYHVVALEEVTVVALQFEGVVFAGAGVFQVVEEAILEVGLAILVPVVGVCLLNVLF